jgi:hypothetical protein
MVKGFELFASAQREVPQGPGQQRLS